ncbi:MAG: DUF4440 domain-containing protein [Planctomycetota bacterium]|jgi:tetratricopeptide (TPR) repeat protein
MRWQDKGGAKFIALAVASTITLAGGGLAFVLVHPVGKKAFKSFLEKVAGKPSSPETPPPAEPPAETPPPTEVQPPETKAAPPSTQLSQEVAAALASARKAVEANDFDAAEAAARKALALDPACAEATKILESIKGRRAQGEELRKKFAHDEAVKAAKEFLAEGDLDRAAERVERALAQDPTSTEALALRATIAAKRKNLAEDAEARHARANALAKEGNEALVDGDHKRALVLAGEALELEPGNVAAENLRVQAPVELAGGGKVTTLETPDAGPVELERPPDAPANTGAEEPFEIIGPDKDASEGPLFVKAQPESEPAGPVSVAPDPPSAPEGPPLPQRAVMAVLAELDRAMESEDLGALERLLSERGTGILTGGRATRAEEIANARAFFELASGIKVERTTKPADVRVDTLTGEARSSYRISYRIGAGAGSTQISRAYRALYRMARERGAWRIASVVIEEERP